MCYVIVVILLLIELGLENIPRDSRYSSMLVELMKREEGMTREGNLFSHQAKDLSGKVDEALKNETKQFFRNVTQHNVKKWIALLQKFDRERGKIRAIVDNGNTTRLGSDSKNSADGASFGSSIDYSSEMNGSGHPKKSQKSPMTPNGTALNNEDIQNEILRLEEDYNDNW